MKTILILDDDSAVRESLSDFFEDREWHVLPAGSAEEALEVLDHETPDGAVVDIRLPGMDGNSFILEAVKKRPNLAYVIATGSPEYSLPETVAGMCGVSEQVFAKPITDLASLEQVLLRQMEKCSTGGDGHGQ